MDNSSLKSKLISSVYKILLLFEDVQDDNSFVTKNDYLKYLDRTYVRFKGRNNEEITDILCGLKEVGLDISQKSVKSIVFHLIELIEKGEV